MFIIAIDPGVSGGISYGPRGGVPTLVAMPNSAEALVELLEGLIAKHKDIYVFVEAVGGFVGTPQPGSRMFTFGANFGVLLGVVAALKLRCKQIRPQKWQTLLSIGNASGMEKAQWKRKLRDHASSLYPNHKVTLKTADALLIWHCVSRGFLVP